MTNRVTDKNNAVSVSFDVSYHDSDSGKSEKVNSIYSLAAKLPPSEEVNSWAYKLQHSGSLKNYPMPMLDEIFSALSNDYNGTDGKQDGIIGDFQQGDIGDCGLLVKAKIISETPEDAETIKSSIKDNNNGTFTVTFKGAPDKNYTVTEEEIKASKDKLAKGDKDARILEIAADKWNIETQGKSIDKGGTSVKANFLLTGRKNTVIYLSKYKKVCLYTVTNDRKIDDIRGEYITNSIEPLEVLQKTPEDKLFHLIFQKSKGNDNDTFKTKHGDIAYNDHSYYIERKGGEIFLHDSHDTTKPPIKMSLSELANKEFSFEGANLDFIPQKKEEGFFARILSWI